MIRVAFLDDHPAVRAGLETILAPEPDLELVGLAAEEDELWPLIRRTHPDVIVLDAHHPGRDGLTLGLEIKHRLQPPAVVLYSATTPATLVVAAAVAGVNAVVSKASDNGALLEAIRAVANAPRPLPPTTPQMKAEAATRLDPADHAILAMRLAGHTLADIGETLWLPVAAIADRIAAIVATLAPNRASSETLSRMGAAGFEPATSRV
jgi:DNA-binding NarL/FixJ family response regulator